jgi:hypothetical protein
VSLVEIYRCPFNGLGIDTTVKTAKSQAPVPGSVFAPEWYMVTGHQRGTMSDEDYTRNYIPILAALGPEWVWLHGQALLYQGQATPSVTIKCFCRNGKFCHTLLIALWAELCWPARFADRTGSRTTLTPATVALMEDAAAAQRARWV